MWKLRNFSRMLHRLSPFWKNSQRISCLSILDRFKVQTFLENGLEKREMRRQNSEEER